MTDPTAATLIWIKTGDQILSVAKARSARAIAPRAEVPQPVDITVTTTSLHHGGRGRTIVPIKPGI